MPLKDAIPELATTIADVRTRVVSVPFLRPEAWRFGRAWGVSNVIVEVETEDGLVGYGEAPGNPAVEVIRTAVEAMGELVKGHDAGSIGSISRMLRDRGWHHYPYVGNQAGAAIEMALWDIAGQAKGVPIHELLGGALRDAVRYYWYLPAENRDPAQAADQAQEGVARGFDTVYLKIGFDVDNDVAILRAVRDRVGPDVAIRADANEAWTIWEARRALAALEELELEFLEQPLDMQDVDGMAFLRAQAATPLGANQTAWLEEQVLELICKQAADVIVTDQHQLGGFLAFARVAGICEVARVPVVKHSFGDLGVTTAATVQQLAVLPEPALAHQTHLELLEHDLLGERLRFEAGNLPLLGGPGLGVEVDRDALAHYEELYRRVGEFSGYAELDAEAPEGVAQSR